MTQPMQGQYISVAKLFVAAPSWVPTLHQTRFQSYAAYDSLYWNETGSYKLMLRGTDDPEDVIYVPAPRIIVETMNRYVGNGVTWSADPLTGTTTTQAAAMLAINALFARERFVARYNAAKRFGLVRGDWLFHVLGDEKKAEGSRLSILPVHPGSYFPVYENETVEGGDPDKLVMVYLADLITIGDDEFVRRQAYRKVVDEAGTITITTELTTWKTDEWYLGEENSKAAVTTEIPETALAPEITAIPVYHIPNFDDAESSFGSSELRGFERVAAGITQAMTDEDVTLALEGLGVYATDTNQKPVNATTGQVEDWFVAPGRVMQNAAGFRRIEGVGSVVPYGDHIERLMGFLREASGATEAANGNVDVTVAESGVALALRLAPTLAKAEEKDGLILAVLNQMLHDLRAWLKVYESINIDDVTLTFAFGDKLPKNKKGAVELVALMMATIPPLLSAGSARKWLASQGMGDMFDPNEDTLVTAEQAVASAAVQGGDTTGDRANSELNGAPAADAGATDTVQA